MIDDRKHARPTEALPDEFDAREQQTDRLLSRYASIYQAPAELVDRIFDASVELLPNRRRTLRLVGVTDKRTIIRHRMVFWGRTALAASVLLAFATAIWFSSLPTVDTESSVEPLALELPDFFDDEPREFTYLLDTDDLSSFDPLVSDMEDLLAELEG